MTRQATQESASGTLEFDLSSSSRGCWFLGVCALMAPAISIGIAVPASGGKRRGAAAAEAEAVAVGEAELLRRRNAELEREVAALRAELEAARRRAETAEEAEERLCVQLGENEVEAVELARAYQGHVEELSRELAAARAGAGDGSRAAYMVSKRILSMSL